MFLLIASTIALVLISLTMLARANDLGARPGLVWHVRRMGFILAGFAPYAIIYVDWRTRGQFLNIYEVIFRCGVGFVFVTTPYLPPFWRWLFLEGQEDEACTVWADDPRGMPKKNQRSPRPPIEPPPVRVMEK